MAAGWFLLTQNNRDRGFLLILSLFCRDLRHFPNQEIRGSRSLVISYDYAGDNLALKNNISSREKEADSSLIGPGKISLVRMIDNLATQKRISSIKLNEKPSNYGLSSLSSHRDPLRQKSSRLNTTSNIDLKIDKHELSTFAQEVSGSLSLI